MRQGLCEQRDFLREPRALLDGRLGHGSADREPVTVYVHTCKVDRAADVDQHLGLRQTHVEDRHERLPARQDARVVAVLGEQRHCLVGRVGADVVEGSRLHWVF